MTLLCVFCYNIYGVPRKIKIYIGESMLLKEKLEAWRIKRYWKKRGRKDFFTWVHRYLRLHTDLLGDSVYQDMYEYFRKTLIAYLRKDIKDKKSDDIKLGELIEVLADIFNKEGAEQVNKYKSTVDELYVVWLKYTDVKKEISVYFF